MGFFNFIYKITNILSNKRKFKIFLIISIVILIVFAWSRGVFASTPTDDIAIQNYQLSLQESFITYMYWLNTRAFSGFDSTAFNNIVNRLRFSQVYVTVPVGQTNCNYIVYFYNLNSDGNSPQLFTTQGTFSTGLGSGTEIDCMLGDINCLGSAQIIQTGNNRTTPIFFTYGSVLMPSACYGVRSTRINDFLRDMGFISELPTTYSTNDDELQAIASSGFNSVNSNIQSQTNQMTNSINNASTSITNSVDNLNNTITDTTTDDTQVGFVSENQQDITSGFFTNLLTQFQTYFTSNNARAVEFPIPFTNKHITFSNRYVRTLVENNENFRPILTIVTAWWWFILGLYVIKDIYKKINAIKSGDLTNIENENITTQLL